MFTYSDTAGSGSGSIGYAGPGDNDTSITIILNRWHTYTVPGTTLVTVMFGRYAKNLDAVDDGFGNLIVLDEHKSYHRTSTRDD